MKLVFQLILSVDKDEISQNNFHIDIDDNANELNTGMLDSALNINRSADTDN